MEVITLGHGSGGLLSQQLIKEIFFSEFYENPDTIHDDSAILNINNKKVAYTTDSFVVNPLFFPGGDIGRLAVCGTVNDISTSGARPIALSCGFIIEEGFEVEELKKIAKSMKETCDEANVKLVTGDTKVVNKGSVDKLFINTSGIGIVEYDLDISGANAKPSDKIIVSGSIGDHGTSIMLARNDFEIESDIKSDAAPLNLLVQDILKVSNGIHVLRDPTRGGIATTLNEIAEQSKVEIEIEEDKLPIDPRVKGVCGLLGFDPLYMANEGKLVVFVEEHEASKVLESVRKNMYGQNAQIIGSVKSKCSISRVFMKTRGGGSRIVNTLLGDNLPRIC